jgi:hypothetical protein
LKPLIPRAPMSTAEWQCTTCDTTNRKLVPRGAVEAADRCVSCKAKHRITAGPRPVRWAAKAR